ncbi:c-type cytochrome [Snuella sedimenti]|uniref:C-type cytochrome n=1 Tax=Snuella sedimenti TaxID=2798802 RepID=A0A8J7IUP9_9FLAO|nr:c-type cytochrome [Snuella sedimenti]MBJ6367045.1 c-type cytochrome [Snuella sedimenti]
MTKKRAYPFHKLTNVLLTCFGCIFILATLVTLLFFDAFPKDLMTRSSNIPDIYYMNYDVSALDDSEANNVIKYGYELFTNTPKYIGPENGNPNMAYSGNKLACKNCHLNNGTKPYSAPLIGIIQRFPQFRGRENKMGTIEERINGCMERSMNGHILPVTGKEMQALVTFLDWLSRYAPKDGNIKGKGFVKINIPNRAIDIEKGQQLFRTHCIVCHGKDGQGVMASNGFSYEYPPLWGPNSFNNGAGMNRVITAAQFIKANMPFGTTYDAPVLTDEEAYDVAGYINMQQRPEKLNLEKDFPDIKKKPVSTPYPPYADPFPVEQHKKGPFQPIIKFYKDSFNITKTK